jgi:cell wall-associated NlpC family hydrolase
MTMACCSWRHLLAALVPAVLLAGCAGAPPPRPAHPGLPSPRDLGAQEQIIDQALNDFYGAPYRSGGTTPTGVDCSGLIQTVFHRAGVSLPRTVAQQFDQGRPIGQEKLRFGDVVFFNRYCQVARRGRKPGYFLAGILPSFSSDQEQVCHNGIYVGQGRFVHASPQGVFVSRLDAEVWRSSFVGARRYLPGN